MADICGSAAGASGRLQIDLTALTENYQRLRAAAPAAEVGAVLKANAYGLGAVPVSDALVRSGCRHIFVAHLDEAVSLRRRLPHEVSFYVLNGLWASTEASAAAANITPVLNTLDQAHRWRELCVARGAPLPAVLQIDSGMSRLGLSAEDVSWLANSPDFFEKVDVRYIMTHLACADAPAAPANAQQRAWFERLARQLPPRAWSISNSAAALTGSARPGEMVRAGLALFGASPFPGAGATMRRVVDLTARVIQIHAVPAGVGVGYGLTYLAPEDIRVATIAAGYADGWPRALGNRGAVYWRGRRLPILGRVSMDSMVVDASTLPPGELRQGDEVELIGPHQSLDEVAGLADTIPYEILTRLGDRYRRSYLPAQATPSPGTQP